METKEEHISPDGTLKLLVFRESDDITIGFAGYSWHTHGEVISGELELSGESNVSPEEAANRLVNDILSGNLPIGVERLNNQIQDVWATYLLEPENLLPQGEATLEMRLWNGSPWRAS